MKPIAVHPLSFLLGIGLSALVLLAMGQKAVDGQVLTARKLIISDDNGNPRVPVHGSDRMSTGVGAPRSAAMQASSRYEST